ncbi:MAG TPA: HAMP domain-containing sensor histidine kinase [Anaerolineales bacterium]|nr:HAMP domain-containing sensor histidine kinase [Anaerolineales bacterium]
MKATELLNQIRPTLLQRVSNSLARGTDAREAFGGELQQFFSSLERAMASGNPGWLDDILVQWTSSPTLTDLQQKRNNVTELLNKIIAITNDVAIEYLPEENALDLLTTVTPIYTYALEKIAHLETEARVAYVSAELTKVQRKLERLDQSKSSFISIAAHELKTPLTLIEGYASMLRDIVVRAGEPQADVLLTGVNLGIQRLRQIIDDLIDVSKIDNDLLSLNLQPTCIGNLLRVLLLNLKPIVAERHLSLTVEDFPGSDLWIYADGERLHQSFHNLLENAIKYTPDGGRVTVDGRTLPGFIEVTITDTGIGIAPEHLGLIFRKYSQSGPALHSSGRTKFKGGGPGLGLPITRGIIEAHGGTIWAESPGCDEIRCPGSTFHVLLPIRTEPQDPKLEKLFGRLQREQPEPNAQESPSADATAA